MRILLITTLFILLQTSSLLAQVASKDIPEWITKGSRVIDNNNATQELYKKAVQILTEAVNSGNLEAAHFLGRAYLEGKGVSTDKQKGYALVKKSADEGNYAIAQGTICKLHILGKSFPQDYGLAKQYCLRSAQLGWELGQWRLARLYQKEGDYEQALYWYEQAAINGNRNAMHHAAIMYMHGKGTKQNIKKAETFLEGAASLGDREAQFSLGYAYYQGNPFAKNDAAALRWYRKAAVNNVTRAQLNYGMMYWGGMGGVPVDMAQAYKWIYMASLNESCKYSRIAKNYLGKISNDLTNARIMEVKAETAAMNFELEPICE